MHERLLVLAAALARVGAVVEAGAPAGLVVRRGFDYARVVVDARGRASLVVPRVDAAGAARAADACRALGVDAVVRRVDGVLVVVAQPGDDAFVAAALVEAWRAAAPPALEAARPAFALDVVDR